MASSFPNRVTFIFILSLLIQSTGLSEGNLTVVGRSITPHRISDMMRYRKARSEERGARIQLFAQNTGHDDQRLGDDLPLSFDGSSPDQLLSSNQWAWHDMPSARPNSDITLPPDTLTVWQYNTIKSSWGVDTTHTLSIAEKKTPLKLTSPQIWISALTFLGDSIYPERLVLHLANESKYPIQIKRIRLWLPKPKGSWLVLHARPWCSDFEAFPASGTIPAGDRGGCSLDTGPLPLTYTALQVEVQEKHGHVTFLWAYLRIKREVFDISGGWVASNINGRNSLTMEPYLKTLKRMHINTGHIGDVGGYTDNPALYDRYPLKLFNKLQPLERYDTDAMLPRIHAVEFLGEPQYGGGRPVPPMEVWRELAPYQSSRLATTVTHSEERIWRDYAGLSDYPHYDAYRITAPAADSWSRYERWGGARIRWGAPLETIGEMTRNLRDLNRPLPIAYWSQGAHHGWGRYGGRQRTSPTPDELRSQAYHALGSRITSLYWFNLSLKSILKFPDLIEPITRVGREIHLLDELLLEGDAYEFRREFTDGKPDWELASVTGPRGGVFFALDTGYRADLEKKEFVFATPRMATFKFRLSPYLISPADVFRVDADGIHDCQYEIDSRFLIVSDQVSVAAIYIATPSKDLRQSMGQERRKLLSMEKALGFDPGNSEQDLATLRKLLEGK